MDSGCAIRSLPSSIFRYLPVAASLRRTILATSLAVPVLTAMPPASHAVASAVVELAIQRGRAVQNCLRIRSCSRQTEA